MIIRRTLAAAIMAALTACSSQDVPQSIGYAYPDAWGTAASGVVSAPAGSQDGTTTAIYGTQTAVTPGVWLFPPNPYQ